METSKRTVSIAINNKYVHSLSVFLDTIHTLDTSKITLNKIHKGFRAATSWKQFQMLALGGILLSCMQWDCLYTFICVYIC